MNLYLKAFQRPTRPSQLTLRAKLTTSSKNVTIFWTKIQLFIKVKKAEI